MAYFYANIKTGEKDGPFDLNYLRSLYSTKVINEESLIWYKDLENWEVLKQNALFEQISQPVDQTTENVVNQAPLVDYDIDNDDEEDDDDNSTAEQNNIDLIESDENICDLDSLRVLDVSNPPPPLKGKLKKMASGFVKNWKLRYFVLENGTFIYYEPIHWVLRGRYNLADLKIDDDQNESTESIRLQGDIADIQLQAPNAKARIRWVKALKLHIEYANLVQEQSRGGKSRILHRKGSNATMISSSNDNNESSSQLTRKNTIMSSNNNPEDDYFRQSDVYHDTTPSLVGNINNNFADIQLNCNERNQIGNNHAATNDQSSSSSSSLKRTNTGNTTEMVTLHTNNASSSTSPPPNDGSPSIKTVKFTGSSSTDPNDPNINVNNNAYQNIDLRNTNFVYVKKDNLRRPTLGIYEVPPVCEGWLSKVGQIFPSVRRRYFVLDKGVIKYYRNSIHESVSRPRGVVTITNYELYSDSSEGKIQLTLMPGPSAKTKRKLVIYCDNFMDRDMWVKAFNAHIFYNSIPLNDS